MACETALEEGSLSTREVVAALKKPGDANLPASVEFDHDYQSKYS